MRVKFPSVTFEEKDGISDVPVFRDIVIGMHEMQDTYVSVVLEIDGALRDCVKVLFHDNSFIYILMDLDTFDQVIIGVALTQGRTYDYSEFIDTGTFEFKLN